MTRRAAAQFRENLSVQQLFVCQKIEKSEIVKQNFDKIQHQYTEKIQCFVYSPCILMLPKNMPA